MKKYFYSEMKFRAINKTFTCEYDFLKNINSSRIIVEIRARDGGVRLPKKSLVNQS